jgi:hypothetical protein
VLSDVLFMWYLAASPVRSKCGSGKGEREAEASQTFFG